MVIETDAGGYVYNSGYQAGYPASGYPVSGYSGSYPAAGYPVGGYQAGYQNSYPTAIYGGETVYLMESPAGWGYWDRQRQWQHATAPHPDWRQTQPHYQHPPHYQQPHYEQPAHWNRGDRGPPPAAYQRPAEPVRVQQAQPRPAAVPGPVPTPAPAPRQERPCDRTQNRHC